MLHLNDTVPKIFQLVATSDWDHALHKLRDNSQYYLSLSNSIRAAGEEIHRN